MFFGFGREPIGYHEPRLYSFDTINRFIYGDYDFFTIYHNLIDNILVFIPYGFLGWLYPSLQSYPKLLISFIGGISLIEFLQWFSQLGFADVDDILLNTTGMTIGFILSKLHQKLMDSSDKISNFILKIIN